MSVRSEPPERTPAVTVQSWVRLRKRVGGDEGVAVVEFVMISALLVIATDVLTDRFVLISVR